MLNRDKLTGFPKVHKRLDLSDFADLMREQGVDDADADAVADVLEGSYLNVWVNHNQDFNDLWLDYNEAVERGQTIVREMRAEGSKPKPDSEKVARLTRDLNALNADALALARKVEAQLWGCEVDEVAAIHDLSEPLVRWINRQAWEYVRDYQAGRKKG